MHAEIARQLASSVLATYFLGYSADLDPIYYCELLDQCAVNDNGDATITNATVSPKSGPQGPLITLLLQINV